MMIWSAPTLHSLLFTLFYCLPLAAILASVAHAAVTIEKIDCHGWKDSYKLSNGRASVVVVPQTGGRIMEFSLDGQNPIWINDSELGKTHPISSGEWHNYGGYKTWPAPQTAWGWPPDPYLESAPAVVEVTGPGSIRIIGAESKKAGIKFVKELTLDSYSARLHLVQKMVNVSDREVEWGVWDVTQVKVPCRTAFQVNPKSRFPEGVIQLHTDPESKGVRHWRIYQGLCIAESGKYVEKIGADPDKGWMLWTSGKLAYLKLFGVQTINANYQDKGSQLQIFNAPGPPAYVEMEVSSPIVKLKPKEETELRETWVLVSLENPVETDNDVASLIKNLKSRKLIR